MWQCCGMRWTNQRDGKSFTHRNTAAVPIGSVLAVIAVLPPSHFEPFRCTVYRVQRQVRAAEAMEAPRVCAAATGGEVSTSDGGGGCASSGGGGGGGGGCPSPTDAGHDHAGSSRRIGVSWVKTASQWKATYKGKHLGLHTTQEAAARAYRKHLEDSSSSSPGPASRGLHSFTSQLNLSAFHGIGGARRG